MDQVERKRFLMNWLDNTNQLVALHARSLHRRNLPKFGDCADEIYDSLIEILQGFEDCEVQPPTDPRVDDREIDLFHSILELAGVGIASEDIAQISPKERKIILRVVGRVGIRPGAPGPYPRVYC